jgi:hypothetical protein
VLGLAAVLAALLAARGPAIAERAEYTWPPTLLPARSPDAGWYTPLLLAQHHAERIAAEVPCGREPTVPAAGPFVLVVSTTRDPDRHNGLSVVRNQGGRTTLRVGREALATLDAADLGPECRLDVRFDERDWTVSSRGAVLARGTVDAAPAVSGLFTDLDLRAKPRLHVAITPHVQDTRPSATQSRLRTLTVALLAAAVLVLLPHRMRRPARPRRPALRVAPQDVTVLVVVGAWWLVAPLHFDDGWVRARQVNALVSGGFSSYYEHFGANLPLATWIEWLQHHVVAHSSSLAIDRLPTFVVVIATWLVCRTCLLRLLGRRPSRRDSQWWAAALTYCVGVLAFGMTLRPEPAIALLTVGVLAACISYVETPSLGAPVVAVLLCGLAVTIHPGGVIASAPVLVCLPRLWRDVRARRALAPMGVGAVLAIGLAWALLLAHLDSDTVQRDSNVALIRSSGFHAQGIFDETQRYAYLADRGSSVPRRESVVLLGLVLIAFMAGRFWRRPLPQLLPSASVGLGLVLLSLTPSKWIWHFGGFIGLAAVAVGIETDRLAGLRGRAGRRLPAVAAAVLGLSVWAALDPHEWGPLDVGRWTLYSRPVPYVAAMLGGAAVVLVLAATRRMTRPDLALLPAVAAGLVAMTIVAHGLDGAASAFTTTPRQAISSLAGSRGCGIADDVVVPSPDSMQALPVLSATTRRHVGGRDSAPLERVRRTTAWHLVRPGSAVGVLAGGARESADELLVTWGHRQGKTIKTLTMGRVPMPAPAGGVVRDDWTFVPERALPARPPEADAVRIEARRRDGEETTTILSRPVSYRPEPLEAVLRRYGQRAAVDPFLFEGTPCASLPTLAYGVAQTPRVLVEAEWGVSFAGNSSPFRGLDNVYETWSVPVALDGRDHRRIVIRWALADPQEALAPPGRRVWLD